MQEELRFGPSKPAGYEHLDRVPSADRKLTGVVYTPRHIVEFTLCQAGYLEDRPIETAAILDPACGGGAFLEAAVTTLAARLVRMGLRLNTPTGRAALLSAVESNVFGIDIDTGACDTAREIVRNRVQRLAPGRLPNSFFRRNVSVDDFLLGESATRLLKRVGKRLGFVVGNPPYVSATMITDEQKTTLRKRFTTSRGRLDFYTVFVERALELVPTGGVLAFVTPDKYLVSQSARALRAFILDAGAVRSIARFKSHDIFENASTVPCVTVVERGGRRSELTVLSCSSPRHGATSVEVVDRVEMPHHALSAEPWQIASPRLHGLSSRLRGTHPTLSMLASRVSAGPATGRDGIFVLPASAATAIEPELLRPAVRGRDIHRGSIVDGSQVILVPYLYDSSGRPSIVDLRRFPGAYQYLRKHRHELEQRHCVRVWQRAWYDLHDPPMCDLAQVPKILVPDVANSNRFAVDPGRFFPLHSVYYILPCPGINPDFLAAILNSRVSTFLLRLSSPIIKDGFQRYRQQFLLTLPVPKASASESQAIVSASLVGDHQLADDLIERLFLLDANDVNSLRASVEQETPL